MSPYSCQAESEPRAPAPKSLGSYSDTSSELERPQRIVNIIARTLQSINGFFCPPTMQRPSVSSAFLSVALTTVGLGGG